MTRTGVHPNRAAAVASSDAALRTTAPLVVFLFVFSILWPGSVFLFDLRLTPVRFLLLVSFVPLLIMLLSARAGRLRPVDFLMFLAMAWMACTLLYHHGLPRLSYAAISVVELLGGYLLGRVLIRNPADYRVFLRFMVWALVFLLPFTLIELLTDRNLLQEVSSKLMPTLSKGESTRPRLGLHRVMSGFEHAILYGLFCATAFAPVLALSDSRGLRRIALALLVAIMTFASLSSAPLLAIAIQVGLLAWAKIAGDRWWLLVGIVSATYVTVDLLSNRTPITILINYISFDVNTAWTRVHIWNFGSAEMLRHPVFGIGLNDWSRPAWLSPSIDNFWLVIGVRHGLLGLLLLITALSVAIWGVVSARNLTQEQARWRTAYVIMMVSVFVTLCTVHVWGGTSSFVMFLVGAGVWFCDWDGRTETAAPEPVDQRADPRNGGALRHTRFGGTQRRRLAPIGQNLAQRFPDGPQ